MRLSQPGQRLNDPVPGRVAGNDSAQRLRRIEAGVGGGAEGDACQGSRRRVRLAQLRGQQGGGAGGEQGDHLDIPGAQEIPGLGAQGAGALVIEFRGARGDSGGPQPADQVAGRVAAPDMDEIPLARLMSRDGEAGERRDIAIGGLRGEAPAARRLRRHRAHAERGQAAVVRPVGILLDAVRGGEEQPLRPLRIERAGRGFDREDGGHDDPEPAGGFGFEGIGKGQRLVPGPRQQQSQLFTHAVIPKAAALRGPVADATSRPCPVQSGQRFRSGFLTEARIILGLESSCDDTAAAVIRAVPGRAVGEILVSKVAGQDALHAEFGGVVPEIAARAHAERLDLVTEAALRRAGIGLDAVEAVAVTAGPGLIGGVLSGVMFAKGLAVARGLPLYGVNHLAGHALTPRLVAEIAFPYLMLLVSGGHCQFLVVEGPEDFTRLGGTIDDAPGEAFDKIAKLLGLGQPGGPLVEREAAAGDPSRFELPRPLLDRPGCDLSFSGLKTAVRRQGERLVSAKGGMTRADRADLCASFQAAVAETLAEKTRRACAEVRARYGAGVLAVAGGVAANMAIRTALRAVAEAEGFEWFAPPLALCTDNGAMIAWAAAERMALRGPDDLSLSARPRWPLDGSAAPMLGSGRKGAKA